MQQQEVKKIIQRELTRPEMRPQDIPELDLYMDQIITLFSRFSHGEGEEHRLTKTMINNYSKARVLPPIKGKKYPREHVLRILLICLLKQTLSINEVGRLLSSLSAPKQQDMAQELAQRYQAHLDTMQQQQETLTEQLEALIPTDDDPNSVLTAILNLAQLSCCAEELCHELVRRYAPPRQ